MRLLRRLATGLLLASCVAVTRPAFAQDASGTTGAAVAGGVLGAYSGAMLATLGSVLPCSQTHLGAACVRWSAVVGGAVGAAGGVTIGKYDDGRLGDVAVRTGIGFLVGAAGGIGIKALAQRVGWEDVFAIGLMGGAVGSAPRGSLIGLGIGGGLGGLLWPTVQGFTGMDALSVSLAGMAIGGLVQWMVDGIGAFSSDDAQVLLPIRVRFE